MASEQTGSSGDRPVILLVEDEEEAVDLSVSLSAEGVARKVLRASGPVVGARVVG